MNSKFTIALSAAAGALAAVLVILVFGFSTHKTVPSKEENELYSQHINKEYKIFSLPLPESAEFAGVNVPMNDPDVREKLDRELLVNTYWQSNTLLCIKRAHRWFPVIEPILKEQGIPDDFKYLSLIESSFTNAVSPSGATGFWQFLDATGKQYGLVINDEVDERYHVEKATEAACRYFKDAYAKFGSWPLVAASYNMGMGGIERQIAKQKQSDYFSLLLNEETARYVFRILAMKEIINNADKYGFVLRPADLYEPFSYTIVEVDSTIKDMADFAAANGVTYKQIKMLNPWLRQGYLTNKNKTVYRIKIPA